MVDDIPFRNNTHQDHRATCLCCKWLTFQFDLSHRMLNVRCTTPVADGKVGQTVLSVDMALAVAQVHCCGIVAQDCPDFEERDD